MSLRRWISVLLVAVVVVVVVVGDADPQVHDFGVLLRYLGYQNPDLYYSPEI